MKVKKFQAGGQMPAEQMPAGGQPGAQQTQGSPEEQIMAIAQQIIQQLGPEGAAMLAQVIMQMLQQASQPQGQPQYQRKGGKLVMMGRK